MSRGTYLFEHDTKINAAEFLALLITCETFSRHCADRLTYLGVDNVSARSWFDKDRCPHFPLDRCAQGVHLLMLQREMKVSTYWVPSADNALADVCSRRRLPLAPTGALVAGVRLRKIKPRCHHVLRYAR